MTTTSSTRRVRVRRTPALVATLAKQSWLFMIGSALFAAGMAVSIWGLADIRVANILCFVGAWFFTAAGLIQVALSGAATTPLESGSGVMARPAWLAAVIQSFGTLMFNVSTSAALTAKSVGTEEKLVWTPDAGGSVAFLVSAVFVFAAYRQDHGTLWDPRQPAWWSAQLNMAGGLAFGVSAVGAFVLTDGSPLSSSVTNWGTFIGAICFFVASAIVLPRQQAST